MNVLSRLLPVTHAIIYIGSGTMRSDMAKTTSGQTVRLKESQQFSQIVQTTLCR